MEIDNFFEENVAQAENVDVDAIPDKDPVVYDLKSGHNGTLKIATEGIKWNLEGEKPVVAGYESGLEGNIELSLYNYGMAYIQLGITPYLYLTAVPNAGSDYMPKVNMTINGVYYGDWPVYNKPEMTSYNLDYKINNLKAKWPDDEESYLLDNCHSALADMGGKIQLYCYSLPLPTTLLKKWDKIVIDDVTGENIAISPYHFFNFHDSNDPNETPFVHIPDDGTEPENYEYLYGNINVANRWESMHMPTERMEQDVDRIFCWSRATLYTQTFPHGNAQFTVGGISPWVDIQPEYDTAIWQALTGWHSDELNLTDKRYHRFKGIQWDVWLDGDGSSMSITIIPTVKGTLPNKTYPIVNYGKQIPTPTQHADFTTPPYRVEMHSDKIDTNWTEIANIVTSEYSPTLFNIAIKCAYINYSTAEVKGEIVGVIPFPLPETVEEMPETRSPDGKKVMLVADDGYSNIIFHFGLYDGDKYDDNEDITDDIEDSEGYNGVGLLTTQYALTSKRTQQLGWKLWGASFVELIEKVNNNPIENVISLKVFPRDFSGTDEEVVLGNVEMGVNGAKITNDNYSYKWDIGTFTVRKKYNSFLDFTPFTKVSIWLPFIGLKDLDTSLFMGKTISVRYIVDIITGACKAELRYNGAMLADFEGSMGIDVSLTASNRAQVEAAFIANTVSSVTRNIGGIVSGGAGMGSEGLDTNFSGGGGKGAVIQGVANIGSDLLQSALNQYHTTSGGSPSPACSAYQSRDVYLIYDRPTYQDLKAFNMTHGRMCMLSRTLGTLQGFTKCNPMIDLSGIPCTEEERSMLLSILSSGFFIN